MAAISVRLPDELDTQLTYEAEIEGKPRSEIAREAIAEYLIRRERERFMREMVGEARAAYTNEAIRKEVLEIAEDFLSLENEATEKSKRDEASEKWWK